MALDLKNCTGEISCDDAHAFASEQIFKMMVTDDGNGCPALKVKVIGSGSGGGGTTNRTPSISVATIGGNTPTGCVAFTILFQGTGGTLDGQQIPDGASISYGNGTDPITVALAYVPPAVGSVIISKLV